MSSLLRFLKKARFRPVFPFLNASMRGAFQNYQRRGIHTVRGWLDPDILGVLQLISEAQIKEGIRGAVGEVGVFQGKLFIALALLTREDERAVAIDVFESQELSSDQYNDASRKRFLSNCLRNGVRLDRVEILQQRSDTLTPNVLRNVACEGFRMFSVDGEHTPTATLNDLQLAEQVVLDGGIVVLDDYFNERWPGVSEGAAIYFQDKRSRLAPFFVGWNKVLLADRDHNTSYASAIRSVLRPRNIVIDLVMFDAPAVYVAHSPSFLARLARRSGFSQRVR